MIGMINQIKIRAIEQVLWAEKELKGKSSAEKRAAVVKKLDDMITLPSYLEFVDDMIIGYIVDKACEKLNAFAGHNFGELKGLTEKQELELAENIDLSKEEN